MSALISNGCIDSSPATVTELDKTCDYIVHLNIRSLSKNYDELSCWLAHLSIKPIILVLSETWLGKDSPTEYYKLDEYSEIISRPRGSRGGGIGFYIRKDFQVNNFVEHKNLEMATIEVTRNGKNLFTTGIYSPRAKTN